MRNAIWLQILDFGVLGAIAAGSPRPRGVGPEFAKFYKDGTQFTCISNPAITLDLSKVNDDYCDCPDGSDEPGTSACSFLTPFFPPSPDFQPPEEENKSEAALPGFYCKNQGHRPSYVPFSNVNDGICDYELCCDGSDEWAGVGSVACEDKCKEIGKKWRKEDEQRQKSLTAASRRRKELVAEAGRLRQETENQIKTLGVEIEGSEKKVEELEKEFAQIEKNEKGKVVKSSSSGGRVSLLAQLARSRIDELRMSLSDVRQQRDSSRGRLSQLEGILSTFKDEYNPNFNDEGVKRAVRAWEDYVAAKGSESIVGSEAQEKDLDEVSKEDGAGAGINWQEWEEKEETDVDILYKLEAYLPPSIRKWIDAKLRDLRVLLVENGILADSGQTQESQAVNDARLRLDGARSDLDGKRNTLNGHREDLGQDYGLEDVFRALKGQCISKDSGEYTYELCWMDGTTQKPKRGTGGDTNMGRYVRMDTILVDDDLPADGKGLGTGERVALHYENGQQCWNGPSRSTTVILACSETDELWKVMEEEKCIYRMEAGTPAVCEPNKKAPPADAPVRDEL